MFGTSVLFLGVGCGRQPGWCPAGHRAPRASASAAAHTCVHTSSRHGANYARVVQGRHPLHSRPRLVGSGGAAAWVLMAPPSGGSQERGSPFTGPLRISASGRKPLGLTAP